jgi:CheY-like chemotaxis protein
MQSPTQPLLLVEDSPEDFEVTVRALRRAGFENEILRLPDGDSTLDFLHRRGAYGAPDPAPRPGIIILDLNLPGTDGREVLGAIKRDPALRRIPVIVLTTSSDQRDVNDCYGAGVNSFVHKPVDLGGFYRAIDALKGYWFETSVLPRVDEP